MSRPLPILPPSSGVSSPSPLKPTSRATTAPAPKTRHHIHRLHHHNRHHHQHNSSRIPQSAIQPATGNLFGDAPQHPLSKTSSWNDARAGSTQQLLEKAKEMEKEEGRRAREEAETKWKLVRGKKEGRRKVEEHLRHTLLTLQTLSTTTTRRLDYTYYSLLEHISAITSLTSLLSTLATNTSTHTAHFGTSTSSLASSFAVQIAAFDSTSQAQTTRIRALERRLGEGREQVSKLRARVARVREQVEGWEREEREGQGRIRRRLRVLWGVVGVLVGVWMLIMVVRSWPREGVEVGMMRRVGGNGSIEGGAGVHVVEATTREEWSIPSSLRGTLSTTTATSAMASVPPTRERGNRMQSPDGKDPRLRLFDEL